MNRKPQRLCAFLAAALLLAARPATALVYQSTTALNASLGAGIAALNAEAKLNITYNNGSSAGCSASLLSGGLYLLTAAHSATGDADNLTASSISITFANTGLTTTAASYVVDPVWNGSLTNGGDLAILSLASAITSITGYGLATAFSAVGDTVTLAGYGDTGVGSTGYVNNTFGTLHYGNNVYLGTYSNAPTVYILSFAATGPYATMLGPGDSGGASLVNIGGSYEIVGVHDFIACLTNGCTANSSFGQYGGDTSVYANATWIDSVIGVPEPASATLLGLALLALRARRRPSARR